LWSEIKGGIKMFDGITAIEVIKLMLPIIIAEICLKVFCLFRLSRDRVKYLPKWGWAIVIICFLDVFLVIVSLSQ
jgi:hypothetical protein